MSIRPCEMWALSTLWPQLQHSQYCLVGHQWAWSCLSSNMGTLVLAGSFLDNFLKVASSHCFSPHHIISSLRCLFKMYTCLFSCLFDSSWGLTFHKGGNLLFRLPQCSQHLAQWRTSINICLMNKTNEEIYENTPNSCSKSSFINTHLLQNHRADIRGLACWNGVFQHNNTLILNLELNCN